MSKTHAVVIGGSMAGLLAARVLSDHFDEVTILERDRLPEQAEHRAGVPQSHHLHTLLPRGQRVLEELFPGFDADMASTGAPQAVWGLDNAFYTLGGWTGRFDSGITTHTAGRVSVEWLVRRRVAALPNVHILTEVEVDGLLAEHGRVIGVQMTSRATREQRNLSANFVVEAGGRRSQAPAWLQALGYDAPDETVIDAHCGYASRWYEIPADTAVTDKAIAVQTRFKQELYRGGGLLAVEGNRWVVTLLGANRDYPPTDEAGFLEFARSLATPAIYEAIKDARPISPIYGYRRLENRMRHYERLARRPENFVVMGDAAIALNPIYGQGMTAAGLEALELQKLLRKYHSRQMDGFAAAFQKRLPKVTADAWTMATGEDRRYPDVEGPKPDFITRFSNRYFDWLSMAMPHDNALTIAFFEAMCLLKPAKRAVLHPRVVMSVLWHNLFSREQKAPAPACLTTAELRAVQ
jgi:2-polyprenyl-6-methoxyphenol hydroxylase-like FAD-dependent oxidoreductase